MVSETSHLGRGDPVRNGFLEGVEDGTLAGRPVTLTGLHKVVECIPDALEIPDLGLHLVEFVFGHGSHVGAVCFWRDAQLEQLIGFLQGKAQVLCAFDESNPVYVIGAVLAEAPT